MSLDDRSSSHDSNKPVSNPLKASEFVIKRAPQLLNTCPLNTVRDQLPEIEEKFKGKLPKKNKILCSDLSTHWLKPGVSLPKLRTRNVVSKRPDAGEPYAITETPLPNKKLFDYVRVSPSKPSNFSLKCSQFEEDVSEIDNEDVVGPSGCQLSFSVPSSEILTFDDVEIPEEPQEPSHALQLWEIWMEKRKRMQEITCNKLNRKPHELIINQGEGYRKVQEDKTLFSYAQLPEANNWRAHPSLCKGKSKAKHKGSLNQVEKRRSGRIVPQMEFVDMPRVIDIEKGYISEGESKATNRMVKAWEKSTYRKERSQVLKEQRSKLKPNEIDVDELAVVGKQICPPIQVKNSESEPKSKTPTIYVTSVDDDSSSVEDRKSIACLVIDGIELKREFGTNHDTTDSNEVKNNYTWQIEFGRNKVRTLVERTITVENRGTMAIAYSWSPKMSKPRQSLDVAKREIREPWFFFNKNSGIFVPGQIYHLKFYHRPKRAGSQTEIWFLKTFPELYPTPEGCRFIITAVAEDDDQENDINSLQRYINRRVAESLVKVILNSIIHDATHPCLNLDYIEYRSFFLERDLFEYHNPKHYYHSSVVAELKDLFQKVSGDSQKEWDLSLSSLLKLTVANASGESRSLFLSTISESSRKLFRPNHLAIRKGKGHRMVYQILCKMTSYLDTDYRYLRKCLTRKRREQKEEGSGEVTSEEYGEVENVFVDCSRYTNATNLAYFNTMFYVKVYRHMCDAAEHIADILETNKFLEPMKKNRVNHSEYFFIK